MGPKSVVATTAQLSRAVGTTRYSNATAHVDAASGGGDRNTRRLDERIAAGGQWLRLRHARGDLRLRGATGGRLLPQTLLPPPRQALRAGAMGGTAPRRPGRGE